MSKLYRYYIKYKMHGIPYYFEFTCYAESTREAEKLFWLNVDGIVEDHRIAFIEEV